MYVILCNVLVNCPLLLTSLSLSLSPSLPPPPSPSTPHPPSPSSDTSTIDEESDHQLPKEKIILLTSCQPVIDYLNTCDHILYQCIVDFLIPDVLRPIPGTLTQAIRNFAKSLEGWLSGNIHGYSSNLIKAKVSTCTHTHTEHTTTHTTHASKMQKKNTRWMLCSIKSHAVCCTHHVCKMCTVARCSPLVANTCQASLLFDINF